VQNNHGPGFSVLGYLSPQSCRIRYQDNAAHCWGDNAMTFVLYISAVAS
jgi:hypothetical protein